MGRQYIQNGYNKQSMLISDANMYLVTVRESIIQNAVSVEYKSCRPTYKNIITVRFVIEIS